MINVTKTFLPPWDEYLSYLRRAWDKGWITNNGELVLELESKLKDFFDVKHLFFCSNGTITLQMAIKAFGLTKEIITTPFSYVATTNAILWENCTPVFCDINPVDFNVDATKIEQLITRDTEAILATHVYGNPCDVTAIHDIAQRHGLKVIYDAAHSFGTGYNGRSLASYGDISTCSFHATKLFHTVEGGCVITGDDETARKLMLFRQFGHVYNDYFSIGINGKNSEFHAAMGLAVLPYTMENISKRKAISEQYTDLLKNSTLKFPSSLPGTQNNYSYFPVLFASEKEVLDTMEKLGEKNIFTRRYFFPSLNRLPFIKNKQACPVSESVSERILCLPLFESLSFDHVEEICEIINSVSVC